MCVCDTLLLVGSMNDTNNFIKMFKGYQGCHHSGLDVTLFHKGGGGSVELNF